MHYSKPLLCSLAFSLLTPLATFAEDGFAGAQFLIGNWEAESNASGITAHTEFTSDIQGHALVRHNHAEYPPANGKPAYFLDDLMVVYREVKPVATKAVYFDNLGYYARYTVTSAAPGQATFVSDPIPGFPRYRVSYSLLPDGRLSTTIEYSPPGKKEAYAPYLQWMSKRATPATATPSSAPAKP